MDIASNFGADISGSGLKIGDAVKDITSALGKGPGAIKDGFKDGLQKVAKGAARGFGFNYKTDADEKKEELEAKKNLSAHRHARKGGEEARKKAFSDAHIASKRKAEEAVKSCKEGEDKKAAYEKAYNDSMKDEASDKKLREAYNKGARDAAAKALGSDGDVDKLFNKTGSLVDPAKFETANSMLGSISEKGWRGIRDKASIGINGRIPFTNLGIDAKLKGAKDFADPNSKAARNSMGAAAKDADAIDSRKQGLEANRRGQGVDNFGNSADLINSRVNGLGEKEKAFNKFKNGEGTNKDGQTYQEALEAKKNDLRSAWLKEHGGQEYADLQSLESGDKPWYNQDGPIGGSRADRHQDGHYEHDTFKNYFEQNPDQIPEYLALDKQAEEEVKAGFMED
jgi:hypothetical protein